MRIYVAGPLTKGPMRENILQAVHAADWLMNLGHAPFVPHLTAFWDMITPHEYEQWLSLDEAWLAVCQALVRLPGESTGADREVAMARRLGIPVYIGMEELMIALEPKVQ